MSGLRLISTDHPDVAVRETDELYTVIVGARISVPVYRIVCPTDMIGYAPAARALGLLRTGGRAVHHWESFAGVLLHEWESGEPGTAAELLETIDRPATGGVS